MDGERALARSSAAMPWWFHGLLGVAFLAALWPALAHGALGSLPALPILVITWLLFMVVRVTVTPENVHVQLGVLGPKVPVADVIDACAEKYPVMKYGGWGLSLRDGQECCLQRPWARARRSPSLQEERPGRDGLGLEPRPRGARRGHTAGADGAPGARVAPGLRVAPRHPSRKQQRRPKRPGTACASADAPRGWKRRSLAFLTLPSRRRCPLVGRQLPPPRRVARVLRGLLHLPAPSPRGHRRRLLPGRRLPGDARPAPRLGRAGPARRSSVPSSTTLSRTCRLTTAREASARSSESWR